MCFSGHFLAGIGMSESTVSRPYRIGSATTDSQGSTRTVEFGIMGEEHTLTLVFITGCSYLASTNCTGTKIERREQAWTMFLAKYQIQSECLPRHCDTTSLFSPPFFRFSGG